MRISRFIFSTLRRNDGISDSRLALNNNPPDPRSDQGDIFICEYYSLGTMIPRIFSSLYRDRISAPDRQITAAATAAIL